MDAVCSYETFLNTSSHDATTKKINTDIYTALRTLLPTTKPNS
jgi:hypothetical protein